MPSRSTTPSQETAPGLADGPAIHPPGLRQVVLPAGKTIRRKNKGRSFPGGIVARAGCRRSATGAERRRSSLPANHSGADLGVQQRRCDRNRPAGAADFLGFCLEPSLYQSFGRRHPQ